MNNDLTHTVRLLFAGAALCAGASAQAQDSATLVEFINEYRSAPGSCEGRPADPVAPLAWLPGLDRVQLARGGSLQQALARAGFANAQAKAISVAGYEDADGAMDAIGRGYCRVLLSTQYAAIGASRSGDSWTVVLARLAPAAPVRQLANARQTDDIILDAVNRARAIERNCGERHFTAAPALSLNRALGDAALAHSRDMARQNYFSHEGKDGREVADRAVLAGYRWRGIGENIAMGQESAEEAVAGWLASPGHCANIMNRSFKDMGAGYAIGAGREQGQVYWTQVFGTPR